MWHDFHKIVGISDMSSGLFGPKFYIVLMESKLNKLSNK